MSVPSLQTGVIKVDGNIQPLVFQVSRRDARFLNKIIQKCPSENLLAEQAGTAKKKRGAHHITLKSKPTNKKPYATFEI